MLAYNGPRVMARLGAAKDIRRKAKTRKRYITHTLLACRKQTKGIKQT